MTTPLDEIDRKLINRLQDTLPLTQRPFAQIGKEIGIDEEQVITRIQTLRDTGILTRFGPFFDAQAMGGAFCLCAIAVPEERFENVTEVVNAFPEVAHNYQRSHELNMWFVLATEAESEIAAVAAQIEQKTGLKVHCFPKEQEYFIGFRVVA
ncbi:Lrp/AsnC family transcriptional regulator [Flexibacterium corallicola]|uniref:Lrp/AsnC family transcriptional regulator n=1 Tax=Flexibacterium corallicola TaxID=3037259 RepID=UPI00286F2039|nr:AsnC family transcriptional regulator [Pseudovibrio sp. M1P-2-3]